ncbi:hypothetical protein [Marinimicrobium sp. ARAG 43.8]|uniref:hypothetical protein n=1 Tax=Marinimicrobium sp. ARAG 43.8 TaxID=3418719 RepID=UPI003CE820DB
MSKTKEFEGTPENWEQGVLGSEEKHASLSELSVEAVSAAVGLKTISIRMQPALLEELKMIADFHSIGYQPLMKQILRRFVDAELKRIVRELHSEISDPKNSDDKTPSPDDLSDCA